MAEISTRWLDKEAREALVDALARDAYAVLAQLDARALSTDVKQATELVATVVRTTTKSRTTMADDDEDGRKTPLS